MQHYSMFIQKFRGLYLIKIINVNCKIDHEIVGKSLCVEMCSCRKFTGVPHILAQWEELVLDEEDQMAWKSPSKHKRSNSTI